jgi:Actinobacteria/chloroflexi VLRF1 release factor
VGAQSGAQVTRPAAGGGRWIDVPPERMSRWLEGFRKRHGDFATTVIDNALVVRAFDDAIAEMYAPPGVPDALDVESFVHAVMQARRIGLLLARRSAVAVGIAYGDTLEVSKVETSYVQGRTAAGGWSQQRFARRRENQAKAAAGEAVDIVLRVLVPRLSDVACVVAGGDKRTVESIVSDRRLLRLEPLLAERFLDVPEPRLAVLQDSIGAARAVRIRVVDPE